MLAASVLPQVQGTVQAVVEHLARRVETPKLVGFAFASLRLCTPAAAALIIRAVATQAVAATAAAALPQVLWAHNSHLGDARATDMGQRRGELNIGQLMREAYSTDKVGHAYIWLQLGGGSAEHADHADQAALAMYICSAPWEGKSRGASCCVLTRAGLQHRLQHPHRHRGGG